MSVTITCFKCHNYPLSPPRGWYAWKKVLYREALNPHIHLPFLTEKVTLPNIFDTFLPFHWVLFKIFWRSFLILKWQFSQHFYSTVSNLFHSVAEWFSEKVQKLIIIFVIFSLDRHIISALHFNLNLYRDANVAHFWKVVWPKFKNGEATVRDVKVEPNFGKISLRIDITKWE